MAKTRIRNVYIIPVSYPRTVPSENKVGHIYHYNEPRFFAPILKVGVVTRPLKHIYYAGSNKMFVYKRGDGLEQLFFIE